MYASMSDTSHGVDKGVCDERKCVVISIHMSLVRAFAKFNTSVGESALSRQ